MRTNSKLIYKGKDLLTTTINAGSTNNEIPTALSVYNLHNSDPVVVVTKTGENLNNYKTYGIYYFNQYYTPTNIPAGVNGWLQVITSINAVRQIFYRQGTPGSTDLVYHRLFSYPAGGDVLIWGPWKQFSHQSI